ncbi:MAG: glycerol-3-phosphate dehydrogenase/oxidase [Chloroflexota bacterium]
MLRSDSLSRLREPFDVLVIGGGASGLGVAVDSASRGYKTVLVEKRDFAQGTSSRSTKLVHGGVRYLEQGNVRLVREALQERGLLSKNAPHLVRELRFLVPAYRRWEKPFYGLGLRVYDLLAGSLNLSHSRVVNARQSIELAPTLRRAGLSGGVLYSDAQFNDSRLAVSLARTATARGAVLLNYAPVEALLKAGGRVVGAVVADSESGERYEVRAKAVVNATGVFSDHIRQLDDTQSPRLIAPSQGIHIVLGQEFLPGETAVLIPHTEDGRVLFVIPWQGRALVGTTDTPVPGPTEEPRPLAEEIGFVLQHAGMYLNRQPQRADVLSVFAGLRPLVKGGTDVTAALSRDHTLVVSQSGLLTLAGGKWTTYRRMAEDATNRLAEVAGLPTRPCLTRDLPLLQASAAADPAWLEFGVSGAESGRFEAAYPGEIHPSLPYSLAMAAYTILNEMPVRLEDVLSRRLRALLLDARAAVAAAPKVARLMAHLQERNEAWVERQVADFSELAAGYLLDNPGSPAAGQTQNGSLERPV